MAKEDERLGRGRSGQPAACEELHPPWIPHVLLVVLHIHLPPDYVNPSVCAQELCGDQRGELACDRGVEGQFVDRARDHEEAVADRQRAREGK